MLNFRLHGSLCDSEQLHRLCWTGSTSWFCCWHPGPRRTPPLLTASHLSQSQIIFHVPPEKECPFEFIISFALHGGTIPHPFPWFMFFTNLCSWACSEREAWLVVDPDIRELCKALQGVSGFEKSRLSCECTLIWWYVLCLKGHVHGQVWGSTFY